MQNEIHRYCLLQGFFPHPFYVVQEQLEGQREYNAEPKKIPDPQGKPTQQKRYSAPVPEIISEYEKQESRAAPSG